MPRRRRVITAGTVCVVHSTLGGLANVSRRRALEAVELTLERRLFLIATRSPRRTSTSRMHSSSVEEPFFHFVGTALTPARDFVIRPLAASAGISLSNYQADIIIFVAVAVIGYILFRIAISKRPLAELPEQPPVIASAPPSAVPVPEVAPEAAAVLWQVVAETSPRKSPPRKASSPKASPKAAGSPKAEGTPQKEEKEEAKERRGSRRRSPARTRSPAKERPRRSRPSTRAVH